MRVVLAVISVFYYLHVSHALNISQFAFFPSNTPVAKGMQPSFDHLRVLTAETFDLLLVIRKELLEPLSRLPLQKLEVPKVETWSYGASHE